MKFEIENIEHYLNEMSKKSSYQEYTACLSCAMNIAAHGKKNR